jgi:putative transposase
LTDDPDFLRFIVERVIQELLEAEMTAHLHADPYERSSKRSGYRNGYKPRQLNTRVGTLTVQVPQIETAPSRHSSSPATNATRKRSCWH